MGVGSVRGCPLIHKVVNRIYAYMLPQMAPTVRQSTQTLSIILQQSILLQISSTTYTFILDK